MQGQQLAVMRALLEQQVLPETAAVLATADKNAPEISTSGKERVVPKILVPLVKVRLTAYITSSRSQGCSENNWWACAVIRCGGGTHILFRVINAYRIASLGAQVPIFASAWGV